MRWIYVLLLAIPLAAAGWWGLYQVTSDFRPDDPGALSIFFALLFVALSATLAPLLAYLNQRFAPGVTQRDPWRVLRHSVWCGLCLTSWAWLQMQRAFNLAFALIIAMIFVAIEVLIVRLKTR
jgi:hypothetical protein